VPTPRGYLEFRGRAIFPLERRLSSLADAVQLTYKEVQAERRSHAHGLKYGFTLRCPSCSDLAARVGSTRVLFARVWWCRSSTHAGHARVARGDFATRVPTPRSDEIGFLVSSFNDMNTRLSKASEEARLSQQQVERERSKLEVILAAFVDGRRVVRAGHADPPRPSRGRRDLGVDLTHVGESLVDMAHTRPLARHSS